ncbi:MAG: hypothetical protein SR1Q5_00915 [Quinella sp. 1Q5]|nr:hypothetical protein [Quinella sp. 1Q5]
MSIIIKRPLTPEQLQNLNQPSAQAKLQAIEDFINYAGLKLLELEAKQDDALSPIRPAVDYTC